MKIWGKLIPIALIAVLLVLLPTSTIAIDSEHRDLLQSIIDNTESIDTDTGNIATSTASIDTKYVIGYLDTSGLQDSDGAIKASAGHLGGIKVFSDGTNDVTVILYDDPDSAEGTVLAKVVVAGGDNQGGEFYPLPVPFSLGCYADGDTTGTFGYIVYYR